MGSRSEEYNVWPFQKRIEHIHMTFFRFCQNRYFFVFFQKKWPKFVKLRKISIFIKTRKCQMNVFDTVLESPNIIFFTSETHRTIVQPLVNTSPGQYMDAHEIHVKDAIFSSFY